MSDGLHRRRNHWYFHVPASLSSDGKAHEESTRTDDYAEAKRIRRDRLIELERGLNLPAEMCAWTVRQAIEHWLDYRSKTGEFRKKTLKLDGELSKALIAKLGGKKLKEIGIADLRMYQAHRRASVKGRTVNLELRPLIDSLKLVGRWDPLEKNYQPFKRERSKIGRALKPAEEQSLVLAAESKPEWNAVCLAMKLALLTGMRSWEIKSLQLEDIALDKALVYVRRQKTKTDAGERMIPLNVDAMYIMAAIQERAEMLGASKPEHYAFPAELSRHTNPSDPLHGKAGFSPEHHQQTFKTAWASICEQAGFCEKDEQGNVTRITLRFHDLRHTFATKLAKQGVPLSIAKGIMGHMGEEETEYYTHILGDDEVARSAVAMLEKMPVRAVEGEERKASIQ